MMILFSEKRRRLKKWICPTSLLRRLGRRHSTAPPGAPPTPVRGPAAAGVRRRKPGQRRGWPAARICSHPVGNTCCWPASSLSSSMSSASLRRAVGRHVPRRPNGGAGIYGVCGAGEAPHGGNPVASCTASHGGGLAGGGCSVAPRGVPSGATPRVVGLASSGDSSPADAPSALVLEGLAPDFATTSGDDIFNFAFVFHIDQET